MENDWLEQDRKPPTEVRKSNPTLCRRQGTASVDMCICVYVLCVQAADTEELEVFRRQWQKELRQDADCQNSPQHKLKQKETEVGL